MFFYHKIRYYRADIWSVTCSHHKGFRLSIYITTVNFDQLTQLMLVYCQSPAVLIRLQTNTWERNFLLSESPGLSSDYQNSPIHCTEAIGSWILQRSKMSFTWCRREDGSGWPLTQIHCLLLTATVIPRSKKGKMASDQSPLQQSSRVTGTL